MQTSALPTDSKTLSTTLDRLIRSLKRSKKPQHSTRAAMNYVSYLLLDALAYEEAKQVF